MSIFKDVLGAIADVTGIGGVGDAAKKLLGGIVGNPEVEAKIKQLELDYMKLELEENKSLRDLLKVEVASEDKFVRRARPATIWLVLCILASNYGILPVVNTIIGIFGGVPLTLVYPELPESVLWLFGSLFGLYTGARTVDKYNKRNGK